MSATAREPSPAPAFPVARLKHRAEHADVIVIGAGLAGSSAAEALARRGLRVRVYEKESAPARAASGNAAGILRPTLTAGATVFSRYSLAAFVYLQGHLRRLRAEGRGPVPGANVGVLHLHKDEATRERMQRALEFQELPADLVREVTAAEASRLAGTLCLMGGLYFPRGGWLQPPALVNANLDHLLIELKPDTNVHSIECENDGARVLDAGGRTLDRASALIIANGVEAHRFEQSRFLPLSPIRGATRRPPPRVVTGGLHCVVCYDGYLTPALGEEPPLLGATFETSDALDSRDEDARGLAASLRAHLPELLSGQGPPPESWPGRVCLRAVSRDRMCVIGPLPDQERLSRLCLDLIRKYPAQTAGSGGLLRYLKTAEVENYRATFYPNLYVSALHGSRGLLYATLGGEILAAQILGEPPPIESDLLDELSPARFARREARQARGKPGDS